MKDFVVQMLSFSHIQHRLDDGIFAIPRLQREFVWNGRKAAALLDSIYRGMPIGSILVWRTGRDSQNLLRKTLNILPPYSNANDGIWFLIDGQQRLSVVHQSVHGNVFVNSDGREVDFSRLTFSVMNDAENNGGTLFQYRKPVEGHFVTIKDVLSARWRHRFRNLPRYKLARIEECRQRLIKYHVPFQFIETNDLEEIRELFIRINSLGTPIGSADRAFARAASFDIRSLANEIKESLPQDFQSLPYETILQAFVLVSGRDLRDVGERAYQAAIRYWERRVSSQASEMNVFNRVWRRLRTAIEKSIDFLRANFSVWGEAFLPSANMVATLSVFFFQVPQANAKQKREIQKWFWATGVGQRYSGRGYRDNILNDAEFFRRLASGRGRFSISDLVDPSDVRRSEYNRRSSLSDSFYCLLLLLGPRYVMSGGLVPSSEYASYANRKHRHHIFPRALLSVNHFNYRQYNSICNICLIVAEENHEFGAKRPNSYLEPYRKKRFFKTVMKSHLIPCKSDSPMFLPGVRRAYPKFVKERHKMICTAFEQVAGIKLFRRE